MQVVQDAGLMLGDGLSGFVFANMLAMAGEKDGWVGIQEAPDSRINHRREDAANGLMCQTKYFLAWVRYTFAQNH